ncbi:hypothetical protein Q8F55_006352 [Vanrija albida]|uniref:Uncharacterized protein n=1 Tax=Vanrija albida TaxID=181172 RepID=A0ABR3PX21_9TREE
MQKGVPSPAEVSAFDPDSPDAMDGTERCNCPKATCKFCASHFHAVEICPELHYVRELEALKYVKHRPWSPASGAASASNSSSTQASPQVYTGTGQTSTARGSSTFFVVTGASHSLIKDKNLLSNLKRLPTPAMFHPALLRPNSPADITMLAEHAGTLAFRRAGQPSIEIRDVFWCPGAAYNILGMDVIGTDEWRISFGDWSLSHLPTGVRFPFSSPIVAAFDVAHTGPGTAQPVVIGEGDAFALGVTPYKVVNGKLRRRRTYARPPALDRTLGHYFEPDELEEHLEPWRPARMVWNGGPLDDNPEDHVWAFLRTLPQTLWEPLFQAWDSGHELTFASLAIVIYLAAR